MLRSTKSLTRSSVGVGDSLPLTGLAFKALVSTGLIDSIGKSISELYPLVDPLLQSIISADGGVTQRPDSEIVALTLASPYLNIAGGTLYGDAVFGIVLYADGLQPTESAERRLWKKVFDTRFEPLYVDGGALLINGYQLYIEV